MSAAPNALYAAMAMDVPGTTVCKNVTPSVPAPGAEMPFTLTNELAVILAAYAAPMLPALNVKTPATSLAVVDKVWRGS